jgi:hypothetical protein
MDEEISELEEEFLHGKCHLLAVALHELTGLPIGAYLDTDIETERTVLVHAFVVDGDDGIDIRGRLPINAIIEDEFDTFDPEFVMLSREDVLLLGHGRRTISQRNPDLLLAKRFAASLIERIDTLSASPQKAVPSP